MLIDSHCHIHDPEFKFDAETTIKRAHANGIDKIIVIGTSPADNLVAQQFAAKHDNIYWSYGFHPEEPGQIAERIDIEPDSKLIAVGEIGLDYHYEPFSRDAQIKLFERMLELAKNKKLPVIFHVREAFEDFWPIVDNAGVKNAVLHSFSDNEKNLNAALERNFYIGVNGLATFAPIPLPPLSHMLLETDAPFLTPAPFRGKINEPSYVKNIAEWVADKIQVPFDTVADQTTANANKLFNLQGQYGKR